MSVSEISGKQITRVLVACGYEKKNNKGTHHLFTCDGRESITLKFVRPNGNVSRCGMRNLSAIMGITIQKLYEISTNKKELKKYLKP